MYDYIFLVCAREKSIFFDRFLKSINNLKLNKKIKLVIVENSKKKHSTIKSGKN